MLFFISSMDTSLLVRHTFWSVQVLGMYFVVSAVGVAQPQFQRLVSVSSLRASQGYVLGLYFLTTLFGVVQPQFQRLISVCSLIIKQRYVLGYTICHQRLELNIHSFKD